MLNLIRYYRRTYKGTPIMKTVNKLQKAYYEMIWYQADKMTERYLRDAEDIIEKQSGGMQLYNGVYIYVTPEELALQTLFELEFLLDELLENGYNKYAIFHEPLHPLTHQPHRRP
jgi:hypothetical protein